MKAARRVRANIYQLSFHPAVSLPRDLSWDEDPLRDRNWRFQFHSLTWVEPLWHAWLETKDPRYLARYREVLQDWTEDNPRRRPASEYSWNDHATALRAIALVCARKRLHPVPVWLRRAVTEHGRTLAEPSFYVRRGNHALNQSIGLLEVGCALRVDAWRALARERLESLVRESVDGQGVSNEHSESYHIYNYRQYRLAIERLRRCGIEPSGSFVGRVARMPRFSAFAATPFGRSGMIGDAGDVPLAAMDSDHVRFVRSGGAAGRRPQQNWATFDAGYAFMRSGWGERRRLADETAVTVRFGPSRFIHGHNDAAAVTLAAYGDRILLDTGGPYSYDHPEWGAYFKSEDAHNTIAIDGTPMRGVGTTELLSETHTDGVDVVVLRHTKFPGVSHVRRVVYSRALDALIVEDRLRSARTRTFHQLWHLHPEAAPVETARGTVVSARRSGPNVEIRQLLHTGSVRIVRGQMDPIQGWLTPHYRRRVPAPVVDYTERGTEVRFITLIVPSQRARRPVSTAGFTETSDGFSLDVRIGSLRQRLIADGSRVMVARARVSAADR